MTSRGWALLIASAVMAVAGWVNHWPELSALGGAGVAALILVLMALGRPPRATVTADQSSLRVMRLQAASARLEVASRSTRRGLRLTEGSVERPSGSVPLRRRDLPGTTTLKIPLDTSERGQRPTGPFTIVHGDPWGLVRRVVDRDEGGLMTVQPRVFPVRRALVAQRIVPDSETAARQLGDTHFHALRDYVLGDEPRMVHWRSSARAGHLVVRQNLAPTSTGITVVLDTDVSAYGSDQQFGATWDAERFESAVEVAASVVASIPKGIGMVHFATTEQGSSVTSAAPGAVTGILDRMAVVRSTPPLEVIPQTLVSLVRSTRCSRLIVVTGTPSRTLPIAVSAASRSVPSTIVIRVGSQRTTALGELRVIDVASAEDLV